MSIPFGLAAQLTGRQLHSAGGSQQSLPHMLLQHSHPQQQQMDTSSLNYQTTLHNNGKNNSSSAAASNQACLLVGNTSSTIAGAGEGVASIIGPSEPHPHSRPCGQLVFENGTITMVDRASRSAHNSPNRSNLSSPTPNQLVRANMSNLRSYNQAENSSPVSGSKFNQLRGVPDSQNPSDALQSSVSTIAGTPSSFSLSASSRALPNFGPGSTSFMMLPCLAGVTQVIRVWRASDSGREQSSKLVVIRRTTSLIEAARLSAEEFGLMEEERDNYRLVQVTVEVGPVVKQSRLPDATDNLASRAALNTRYYLKHNRSQEPLVADEVARGILADSRVALLQLTPEELAVRLTLDDYEVFRTVTSTEYIDEVFGISTAFAEATAAATTAATANAVAVTINSASGTVASSLSTDSGVELSPPTSLSTTASTSTTSSNASITSGSINSLGPNFAPAGCITPHIQGTTCSLNTLGLGYPTGHANLDRLTELVNREAYWAPTELCTEPQLGKRVELLKKFIKLAKFCRDLRNYNTLFCIMVGLHQNPVERLRQTWERLPNKYHKIYRDLSLILDTSRNFFQYRSMLAAAGAIAPSPMLPYLPLVIKDLTFLHLGNASRTPEGLINFVKLRMIAKEVRATCRMCNVEYDQATARRLLRGASSIMSVTSMSPSTGLAGGVGGFLLGVASAAVAVNPVSTTAIGTASIISYPVTLTSQATSNASGSIANLSRKSFSGTCNVSSEFAGSLLDVQLSSIGLTTLKRTTAPTARPASPISHEASVGETGANSRCKPPGPASPMSSTSSLSASQSTSATSGIAANMSASPSSFVPSTNPIGSLLPTAGLTAGVAGIGSGSGALGNPKRAYEAWLMELRVRTYLANLRVVREPPILTEMSLRVEPNKVAGRERRAAERAAKERIKEREREREKEKERAREEKKKEKEKETEKLKDKVSTADLPSDSANQNANSSTSGQPSSPLAASGNSKANGPNVSLSDLSELDTINQLAVDPLSTQAGRLGSRPLTRPILGAQSLEDARKLLALSESSRRTQRRLPSIIFPTGPSLVPSVNTTFNAMLCYPAATVSTISSTTSSLSIPATNVALASSSITSGYTHHPPSNSSSSYSAVPMPRQLVPQSYVHSIQQPSCHYHQRQQQQQAYSAQQMTRSLPADSRISQALPVLHQPPGHHIQVVHSQSGHLHHMHSHSTQLQHNQQQQLQQTQLNIHKHQANLVRHQQSSQQQQRQHQQHYQYRFQHQNHHHQQQRHSQQSGLVQVPPTPPSLASQEMLSPQAPGLEIPSTGHASLVGIGFEKALLPLAGCSATTILFPPRSSRLLMNGLIPAPARLATRTGTLVVSVADPDSNAGGSSGLTNQSRNFYDRLASGQVITSELHQSSGRPAIRTPISTSLALGHSQAKRTSDSALAVPHTVSTPSSPLCPISASLVLASTVSNNSTVGNTNSTTSSGTRAQFIPSPTGEMCISEQSLPLPNVYRYPTAGEDSMTSRAHLTHNLGIMAFRSSAHTSRSAMNIVTVSGPSTCAAQAHTTAVQASQSRPFVPGSSNVRPPPYEVALALCQAHRSQAPQNQALMTYQTSKGDNTSIPLPDTGSQFHYSGSSDASNINRQAGPTFSPNFHPPPYHQVVAMKQQHNLFSISAGTEVSRPIALHQVSSPVSNLLSSSTTALPTTVASLVTAATVANHSSPPPPKPAPPSCQVRPLYQKVQVQHPVHAYQQQLQQQLQRQQQQPPRSTD